MSVLQDRITYADVTILACMPSSYFRVAGVCGNNYFFLHLHLHLQRFLVNCPKYSACPKVAPRMGRTYVSTPTSISSPEF